MHLETGQNAMSQGIESMHRARALGQAVVSCEGAWMSGGDVDPISLRIARLSLSASKAAIYLLATTRLRWCDLAKIDMQAYIQSVPQQIQTSKNGRPRTITPRPSGSPALWQHVHVDAPISNVSVRTLTRDIQRCLNLSGVPQFGTAHTGTHVFRHLWASWRSSEGDPIATIAVGLGHWSTSSTMCYIHDQLVCEFRRLKGR